MAIVLLSVVCLFLGFSNWLAWREGFDMGRSKARREGSGIDTDKFAKSLATLLDIQADGGDSPVAYVKWAIQEAKKESAHDHR